MTHDFYRPHVGAPASPRRSDADGKPTAMTFRLTSQSVTGRVFGLPVEVQDPLMTEAAIAPYEIPATHARRRQARRRPARRLLALGQPRAQRVRQRRLHRRAGGGGQGPVAYRMSLLGKQPRFSNVLKLAAEKAGWGTPPPAGRSRGIALMEGYDTYMAQVAEISMKDGEPVVHRVVAAADLGRMVNPDTVEAQIQSSIIFGLTRGAVRRDHARQGPRAADQLPQLPAGAHATRRRRSTSSSCRAPRSPAASASRPPR